MNPEIEKIFRNEEVEIVKIKIKGRDFTGIKINLPNAPLIVIESKELIIGCGYIDADVMEKVGNAACIVTGVKTFEDVLKAEIKTITSKAAKLGIKPGMPVISAIEMLSD